jgi:hypothetical protein
MVDKKVILVGSSSTLIYKNIGKKIDEFDEIWRTNHSGHPKAIQEFPSIIGSKYGCWYIHAIPWSGFELRGERLHHDYKTIFKYEKILFNGTDVELKQLELIGQMKKVSDKDMFGIYNFVTSDEKKCIMDIQKGAEINSAKLIKSDFDNVYLTHFRAMKDCYSMMEKRGIKLLKPPVQKPSSGLRILVALLNQYDHIHMVGFDRGISGNFLYHQNIYNKLKSVGVELRPTKNHGITKNENRVGKKSNGEIAKHHLSAEYDFMMKLKEEGRLTFV